MDVEFKFDVKRQEVLIVSDFFSNIREAFSVKNKAAFYNRFSRFVPSRIYSITPAGYCELGLVPEILAYLYTQNIPFNIKFNQEYHSLIHSLPYCTKEVYELPVARGKGMELRPYQKEAVEIALKTGYGTTVVGTGGGKTLIMATLLHNIVCVKEFTKEDKHLIIVPDIGLVEQTYKDFITYGFLPENITKWTGSNEINPEARYIIANLGILQSEKSDLTWFKKIKTLFVDEVHKLRRGNKVNKLIDRIPTFNRFGFTGTLPEDNIDKWNIIGKLGPVIYEKSTSDLREFNEGKYIANANVLGILVNYDRIPDYTSVPAMQRYRFELDYIYNSEFRYKIINTILANAKNNTLVLVDHIDHGERMYNHFKNNLKDKEIYFIQGSVDVEDRRKVQNLMEEKDNIVCVAISKIFSTGISIKNIHYIVFAAGGKSKIKVLQSIGRGLRLHENKKALTIVDIVDNLVYGKKHFTARTNFYALEKIQVTTKEVTENK